LLSLVLAGHRDSSAVHAGTLQHRRCLTGATERAASTSEVSGAVAWTAASPAQHRPRRPPLPAAVRTRTHRAAGLGVRGCRHVVDDVRQGVLRLAQQVVHGVSRGPSRTRG
jgi:hypothetical protein